MDASTEQYIYYFLTKLNIYRNVGEYLWIAMCAQTHTTPIYKPTSCYKSNSLSKRIIGGVMAYLTQDSLTLWYV